MTEIERKVQVVRKYIIVKKNIDIKDIILKDGEDLSKLDFAYRIALNFFNTSF